MSRDKIDDLDQQMKAKREEIQTAQDKLNQTKAALREVVESVR